MLTLLQIIINLIFLYVMKKIKCLFMVIVFMALLYCSLYSLFMGITKIDVVYMLMAVFLTGLTYFWGVMFQKLLF